MMTSVAAPIIMSKSRLGSSATLMYESTYSSLGYRKAVNDSTANRYTKTTNKSVSSMAADTFHEGTARKCVNVRMACDEVTQMKKRKITVPCASSRGISRMPCLTSRISRGIMSVVTSPLNHFSGE